MNKEIKKDIEILWDYLCLKSEPTKGECIIGLGSILKFVPQKCAELYKQKIGKYIIFSGNCGKGTEGVINQTEAEIFKDIALKEGVLPQDIYLEKEATNTYENFKYILKVLKENKLSPKSFVIVGKPYQERRAKCIAEIELKDYKFSIASFYISFSNFVDYVKQNNLMSEEDVINEVVAEVNIGILAPKYGVQSADSIPDKVLKSYERLCNMGYTKYLVTDDLIRKTLKRW